MTFPEERSWRRIVQRITRTRFPVQGLDGPHPILAGLQNRTVTSGSSGTLRRSRLTIPPAYLERWGRKDDRILFVSGSVLVSCKANVIQITRPCSPALIRSQHVKTYLIAELDLKHRSKCDIFYICICEGRRAIESSW